MMKTAFITGAASGIGLATAKALYEQGWQLGLADINETGLRELTLGWDEQRIHCYGLDVRQADQCRQVIGRFAGENEQQLGLLFNCAGVLQVDHFENISAERHQQIIDINVTGVINCCLAAFPYLRHTSGSLVINMSSASATYGIPLFASYSASKFAVSGLTEALDLEWQDYGIRVVDIMPPFVSTPMLNEQEKQAPVIERLGINLYPEDIAEVVLLQITKPRTHRAVSLPFKLAWALSQILPRSLLGNVLRFLSR